MLTDERYWQCWGVAREDDVAGAIAKLPPETIVYAHNGGKFDFHFLLPNLDAGPITVINGRLARARIRGREIRDSWLLLPEPLRATGLKSTIDYASMEAGQRESNKDPILAYLRDDCVGLYQLLESFFEEHPGRPLTLPSAALARWSELENRKPPRLTEEQDTLLRPFYFGGRVEAIVPGIHDGPMHIFDINSAYAYAMMHPHPDGPPAEIMGTPAERYWDCLLAIVEAESDGALPAREEDGSISFPRGHGTFLATGHELSAGLDTGRLRIKRFIRSFTFFRRIESQRFVATYFEKRAAAKQRGDKLADLVYKRTINAVYGKLGQDPRVRHEFQLIRPADPLPKGWILEGALGPWLVIARPKSTARGYLHVGAAASITGFVRAMLLRALHVAKNPVYCDTDSIICDQLPLGFVSHQIGHWKDEGECAEVAIAGKKIYACRMADGTLRTRSKGAKLTMQQIYSLTAGDSAEWESEAPTFRLGREPLFVRRVLRRKQQ